MGDSIGAVPGARLSGYRIIDSDSAAGRANFPNTDENLLERTTKSRQPGDLIISFLLIALGKSDVYPLYVFYVVLYVFAVTSINLKELSSCQPTHPSIANSAWAWSGEGRGPLSAGCTPLRRCSITAPFS